MSDSNINLPPDTGDLQRSWGWLLSLGILFVILGGVALGMTVSLTLVSMFFFGVLLIIGGFLQIIDVFNSKRWVGALWHTLIAILYIICGCLVLYDPFLASILITALLGIVLIIIGVTRFFMAFVLKDSKGWGWVLLAGLVTTILGILILMQWPISGLWVIGLFIAIEMIIAGWTYIFMALACRHPAP